MEYLMSANDQKSVAILRDRLYYAQYPSHVTSSVTPPTFPFTRVDVKGEPALQLKPDPHQQSNFVDSQNQVTSQPGQSQVAQPGGFYNPSNYQANVPSMAPTGQPQLNQPSYYQGQSQPPQVTPTIGAYQSQPYGGNTPNIQPPPSHVSTGMSNRVAPPPHGRFTNAPPPSGSSQFTNPTSAPPPMAGYGATATPGAPNSYPPPPPSGTGGQHQPEPPHSSSTWSADGTHAIAKKHQPTNYTPPAPITMPIFNADQQQPAPSDNPTGNAVPPIVHQGSGVPPGAPPQGPVTVSNASQQPEPAKEVMKGPIPAEHLNLQEAFDGLVSKCRGTAMNQQTKKKLDDVTRKLEALYDKLRDQKLSPSILGGLHNIAQACQRTDYASGYQAYTNLISSGSFSEISSFMPGIKTLMQIATQLRV